MVTVEKYIRKLLFEHDCVIIPDFGGLLTHHIEAHYDIAQSVFLPSTKRVAFNEVLKLDDGLLTYYISVNERIPREEAIALVRKYVESIRQSLKEGSSFTLEAIGCFSANSEGKPVFEPDYSQNFNNDWYGMDTLDVHYYSESSEEKVEEAEWEPETENEDIALVPLQQSTQSRTWVKWAAAAIITGAVFTMSIIYKPVDNSVLSTLNPFYGFSELYVATISRMPQISRVEKSEKAGNNQLNVPSVPVLPDSQVVFQGSEVEVEKPLIQETEKLNNVNKPVVDQTPLDGNYFLIAGSFEKMKNAQLLKDNLVREGFKQAQVMDANTGRLIKVSVGAYQSMSLALVDKGKVDEITRAESWVFHKK